MFGFSMDNLDRIRQEVKKTRIQLNNTAKKARQVPRAEGRRRQYDDDETEQTEVIDFACSSYSYSDPDLFQDDYVSIASSNSLTRRRLQEPENKKPDYSSEDKNAYQDSLLRGIEILIGELEEISAVSSPSLESSDSSFVPDGLSCGSTMADTAIAMSGLSSLMGSLKVKEEHDHGEGDDGVEPIPMAPSCDSFCENAVQSEICNELCQKPSVNAEATTPAPQPLTSTSTEEGKQEKKNQKKKKLAVTLFGGRRKKKEKKGLQRSDSYTSIPEKLPKPSRRRSLLKKRSSRKADKPVKKVAAAAPAPPSGKSGKAPTKAPSVTFSSSNSRLSQTPSVVPLKSAMKKPPRSKLKSVLKKKKKDKRRVSFYEPVASYDEISEPPSEDDNDNTVPNTTPQTNSKESSEAAKSSAELFLLKKKLARKKRRAEEAKKKRAKYPPKTVVEVFRPQKKTEASPPEAISQEGDQVQNTLLKKSEDLPQPGAPGPHSKMRVLEKFRRKKKWSSIKSPPMSSSRTKLLQTLHRSDKMVAFCDKCCISTKKKKGENKSDVKITFCEPCARKNNWARKKKRSERKSGKITKSAPSKAAVLNKSKKVVRGPFSRLKKMVVGQGKKDQCMDHSQEETQLLNPAASDEGKNYFEVEGVDPGPSWEIETVGTLMTPGSAQLDIGPSPDSSFDAKKPKGKKKGKSTKDSPTSLGYQRLDSPSSVDSPDFFGSPVGKGRGIPRTIRTGPTQSFADSVTLPKFEDNPNEDSDSLWNWLWAGLMEEEKVDDYRLKSSTFESWSLII